MSTSLVIVLMLLVVAGVIFVILSNSGPKVTIIKEDTEKDDSDA